jgi:hypothetical protein
MTITGSGGAQLWVQVWEYGNDNPGTYSICTQVPAPPATNDECTDAIAAPLNTTGDNCALTTSDTVYGATHLLLEQPV